MTLGVLGGLGPMSSVYFYELLVSLTDASTDQEHLDVLISSRATTPDRTAFIVGTSDSDPAPVMAEEARRLESAGADVIAIPCNTAHYFYEKIHDAVSIPVLNIIDLTCKRVAESGAHALGILATEGTIKSGAYGIICEKYGLAYVTPNDEEQAFISHTIYERIKRGEAADTEGMKRVIASLISRGADKIVLGCTELSLMARECDFGDAVIDSLETLAASAIEFCGKKVKKKTE